MLKIAFHLAFTATLRIGELLGLTWDDMDISEEAIADNKAYVIINKQVERVSKDAIEALNSKEIIVIFPSQKKNNRTVRVLKTPKTDSSVRKVFIPKSVAQCLIDLKADQDEIKEVLGNEYQDYNLVMATTFGLMENAFYNKENLNPQIKAQDEGNSTITVPDGVDAELLMKVLGNPEMAALLTSLAKTMKV